MFRYRHVDARSWSHFRGSFVLSALARASAADAGRDDAGNGGRDARRRRRGHAGRDAEAPPSAVLGDDNADSGAAAATTLVDLCVSPGHVVLLLNHQFGHVVVALDAVVKAHRVRAAQRAHLLAALGLPSDIRPEELRHVPSAPLLVALFTTPPAASASSDGSEAGAGSGAGAPTPGRPQGSNGRQVAPHGPPPPTARTGRVVHTRVYSMPWAAGTADGDDDGRCVDRLCVVLSTGWVWWWEWAAADSAWKLLGSVQVQCNTAIAAAVYCTSGGVLVFSDARGVCLCQMELQADPVLGSRIVSSSPAVLTQRCARLAATANGVWLLWPTHTPVHGHDSLDSAHAAQDGPVAAFWSSSRRDVRVLETLPAGEGDPAFVDVHGITDEAVVLTTRGHVGVLDASGDELAWRRLCALQPMTATQGDDNVGTGGAGSSVGGGSAPVDFSDCRGFMAHRHVLVVLHHDDICVHDIHTGAILSQDRVPKGIAGTATHHSGDRRLLAHPAAGSVCAPLWRGSGVSGELGLVGPCRVWQLLCPSVHDHARMLSRAARTWLTTQHGAHQTGTHNTGTGAASANVGVEEAKAAPAAAAEGAVRPEVVAADVVARFARAWGPSVGSLSGLLQLEHAVALRTWRSSAKQASSPTAAADFVRLLCQLVLSTDAVSDAAAGDNTKPTTAPAVNEAVVQAVLQGARTVGDEAASALSMELQNPALAVALLHSFTDGVQLPPESRGMMEAFLEALMPATRRGPASGNDVGDVAWRQQRLAQARGAFERYTPLNLSLLPTMRRYSWLEKLLAVRQVQACDGAPFGRTHAGDIVPDAARLEPGMPLPPLPEFHTAPPVDVAASPDGSTAVPPTVSTAPEGANTDAVFESDDSGDDEVEARATGGTRRHTDAVPREFGWTRVAALGVAGGLDAPALGGDPTVAVEVGSPAIGLPVLPPNHAMAAKSTSPKPAGGNHDSAAAAELGVGAGAGAGASASTGASAGAGAGGAGGAGERAGAGVMPVSQQGGRIGSESGGAVSLSTTALLLRSMEAAMGIVPLDAARPAPASPRRIRSAIHHRTRGQAPSPLPSPQLQWYHRDTRLNPSVFHREPRAVTVRRQLGAVTEGEDDSETDSDTDGSDDDGAESGYGPSDMPSRSGSSVASGAKHSSLGFKTSSENAYFETLVRLNYVLHPERVADLVELVDHLCPPSYKAGQKTRRGAGSAGPDPVPYRSHFVRALLALPVGALTEVAEAHPLPPPGCDATKDHQSPWLWAHVALLRKAGRGVDAIRLLLRTGRWLAALDMLTEAERADRAAPSSRFAVSSHAALPAAQRSFGNRWAMPASDRLAFFHELLCHALKHGLTAELEELWQRRPATYGLWSVLGALEQTHGSGVADVHEPSGRVVAPPPDVPVFCSDDTTAPHVPLSALLPQLQSLVDNANAELGELSVFWARTGSKAARGQLLRGWGGR